MRALKELQGQHGLPVSGRIDQETLGVLLELEEHISINVNEGSAPARQPAADSGRGYVSGRLVDADGAAIARARVVVSSKELRAQQPIGKPATTNAAGGYALEYARKRPLNIIVQAFDAHDELIASSSTVFQAAARVTIDLTTAEDGVIRSPSQYTKLLASVTEALRGTALEDLEENKDKREVSFLANSIGASFGTVADLYIARVLALKNRLSDATLFGLFKLGTPASLAGALANLPDQGIDAAFTAQVLASLLGQVRATLDKTLTLATQQNVLPASYAHEQAAQLDLIDELRLASVADTPYVRGKTPLSTLLKAAAVDPAVSSAFLQAYAASGRQLSAAWKTLNADKALEPAALTHLGTTLRLGALLAGNLPLLQDSLARIDAKNLASVRDLALLSASDWESRIERVDPNAASIPQVTPGDTAAERTERFAKALAQRLELRYPTTAFVGGLQRTPGSAFRTRETLITFLSANPTLSLRRSNIDKFMVTNKLNLAADALAELKLAQRLHRTVPQYYAVEALHTAGYSSAQAMYFKGRAPFLAQMTGTLGASMAKTAYARSQMIYGSALVAFGRYNRALNSTPMAAVTPSSPDPALTAGLPDLQALFGSLDYFECQDCQSVYSPAAYLVDLLQYLSWFTATPPAGSVAPIAGIAVARDLLLLRRPEIANVALNCDNTNIIIPYIDLVNEVLEAAIAPVAIARPAVMATVGTSAERRALPQQIQPLVAQAAYAATAGASYPLSLPFDVNFAITQAYVAALGTTRAALLKLFPSVGTPATLAGATLGINAAMQAQLNQANNADPWTRWGLAQNPAAVIDPKTRQAYAPNPADWVAALNHVPVLMDRAGLTLQQLYQLLEVAWVTQGGVVLQVGTVTVAGLQLLSADTDAMIFQGLTAAVLDRANRFLRLWKSSGLQMWELDWAVQQAGAALDDAFLVFLTGAMTVQKQLNLPFQEVLTFWGAIETRDVVSYLGDEDVLIRSTYSEVFASPTMLASWSAVFGNPAALSAAQIIFPATPAPTALQLQPLNGIVAALGISAADVATILTASGAANTLTLPTLGALLCYARLAAALSLPVADLVLWIGLSATSPFSANPADTLEFLRRLKVLQDTGIAVRDLDYLLRGQSTTQSSLAFTQTQSSAVLQSIRDSVAKVIATSQLTLAAVSNAAPIVLRTAKPHGLSTGTRVFITGVTGNTAANGFSSMTTVAGDPNALSLDGSAGNGAWAGGGSVTANLDAALQTTVIATLASATGITADVVAPVLAKSGILPLDAATIVALLGQAVVDPTQFAPLLAATTRVAKAGALFTALTPSPAMFTFMVAQASVFGWLDPSALPLAPVAASPYAAFEKLLRAQTLDARQSARTPKLFDILGAWQQPGGLPPDTATALGGPSIAVAAASNTAPIVITTAAPHGLSTGMQVVVSSVTGNTAANGTFSITVTGPAVFSLDGSAGNGAWLAGGTISVPSLSLAVSLNASVSDATAIATTLGATAPSLVAAAQAGTLADVSMLWSIASALDVVARYGLSGATLNLLIAAAPGADTSAAARGAFQAQYAQSAWLAAVQPIEDALREKRRDALVAYLLGPVAPVSPGANFLNSDDIFNYYLIDPEMCACGQSTRLLQPSLAIQQFVQQCFLNLSIVASVDTTDARWDEWSWRQQYRLWQANREVFLYPENYVLPELRKNASPIFSDLENDLKQSNCNADAAEAAFQNYLRKLVGVSRLVIAAHYQQTNPDGSTVLHVFGRTRGTPPQWYYRTRQTPVSGTGVWSAWVSLNLDIASDQLVPFIWDRRLHLLWPIFRQLSEKAADQTVPAPSSTPAPSNVAQKFWSIQFAMSELSAGQWQAKRAFDEKMYFIQDVPPLAFSFKAYPDPFQVLQIQTNLTSVGGSSTNLVTAFAGAGILTQADAGLQIREDAASLPPVDTVDTGAEPSFSLVQTGGSFGAQVVTPTSYNYRGQDLVWGGWNTSNPGSVALNVTAVYDNLGHLDNLEVLGSITNPHLIVPQQEVTFDAQDPFFVSDADHRTYLVQPQAYVLTNSSQPVDPSSYGVLYGTRFEFTTFYHPYARTFLRELEIGGIPALLARDLQTKPASIAGSSPVNFANQYTPNKVLVAQPYPGVAPWPADVGETWLDFDPGCAGAYSLYNWEIFYHGPMFVAAQLLTNRQYADSLIWLEYIFNPTDSSSGAAPQRFWQMAPFNAMNASDWSSQQIGNLLAELAADTQQGISDPKTSNAILAWMADPFDPHMVASTRIGAYGMATVMKFLDVLIAWIDSLYAQYTAETVNQAEQLCLFADMLLGPEPQQLRLPAAQAVATPTYATLQHLDIFSNTLVNVENLVVAPEPPASLVSDGTDSATLPQFPGNGNSLLFCIPPNTQLLGYWGKVASRLYNIRHCLNAQGIAQPLPLYAPPLNPLELIAAQGSGAGTLGTLAIAPIYRFNNYLQKAIELANDVRAYGGLILSALEKQDAETLAALRATQELDIQTRTRDVRAAQVTEAQDQVTVLNNQKAVTQIRYAYYKGIAFMNAWETAAISLQGGALIANGAALILDMTSGVAHLVPKFTAGASGFGGTPTVTATEGGENFGHSASSWASVSRSIAGLLSEAAGLASTMGGYQRRQDDWTLQANLAQAELTQIASQITAAQDRVKIANTELSNQDVQIANAQAVNDFMTSKYTNAQLYNWMISQLTGVYTQAYQLAFSLALQAQTAYQYELGRATDRFIQFAYWDNQHNGLTAGESLLFDLRRMESQYLANNVRELELTKHVSLALSQPLALVQLLQTGSCTIALDESMFDADHPGHFFRRLRSVALTIPCVSGPYTGVNATLAMSSAVVRNVAPSAGYAPWLWATAAMNNDPGISASPAVAAMPVIATSSAQNDAGLFDVNLRDERWLPFEGQGAVSQWSLSLDPRDNNFDISSVTDVVLHLRYSARFGGDASAVRAALKPKKARSILVSTRNTFGDAYYAFFNPANLAATQQSLTLPISAQLFPFSNLGVPAITSITLLVVLAEPLAAAVNALLGGGVALDGTLGIVGGAAPVNVVLHAAAGVAADGTPIAGLSSGDVALALTVPAPAAPPASISWVLPQGSVPAALNAPVGGVSRLNAAQISDILLLISYNVN